MQDGQSLGQPIRPLLGTLPSKLQLLSRDPATCAPQVLASMGRVTGLTPALDRIDVGEQLGPEKLLKPSLGFSDSEMEEPELGDRSQSSQAPVLLSRPGNVESQSMAPLSTKLSDTCKDISSHKGEPCSRILAKLGASGPEGDKAQRHISSLFPGEAPSLSTCSSDYMQPSLKQKLLSSAQEDLSWQGLSGEGGPGPRGKRKEPPGLWVEHMSKLVSKDPPGGCIEAGPLLRAASGVPTLPPGPSITLPATLASESAILAPSGATPGQKRPPPGSPESPNADGRPGLSQPYVDSNSSRSSSLAPCTGFPALGEVSGGPWAQQSWRGSWARPALHPCCWPLPAELS